MKIKKTEKGQALILIIFAIVGMIGITALAVDGGNTYAERRRAQNAADAVVLDAALAKVRGGNLYTEGLARANSNNFVDTDAGSGSSSADTNVEIYSPPISGPYSGNSEYIQVIITSTVQTYFGPVIGVTQVVNRVQAVARAAPSYTAPMFLGNAIVSLADHECKAITFQGNANATVTGGGLFVNSDCANSAFFNNSGAAHLQAPCLQAVGGVTYKPGSLTIPPACIVTGSSPLPPVVYPNPTCSGNAVKSGDTLSPGNFSGTFPPNGVTKLASGIYCVDGNFRMNAKDTLEGTHVVIVMQTGDIRFNGGAEVNLSAPTTGPYAGLLIFMPESNNNEIVINGNSSSTFTGTILAPSAPITINGTGSASGFHSQVIGYTVDLSGTGDTFIQYDDSTNYDAPVNPAVELIQ